LNSGGYNILAEPAEQATPLFRAPNHIEPYNLLWVLSDWNRFFLQKAVFARHLRVKVVFILEEATEVQRGNRDIALLFL
jgi:hypothetical protein